MPAVILPAKLIYIHRFMCNNKMLECWNYCNGVNMLLKTTQYRVTLTEFYCSGVFFISPKNLIFLLLHMYLKII